MLHHVEAFANKSVEAQELAGIVSLEWVCATNRGLPLNRLARRRSGGERTPLTLPGDLLRYPGVNKGGNQDACAIDTPGF